MKTSKLSAAKPSARKLALAALLGLSLASSAMASISFVASGVNKETGDAGQSAEADVSLVGSSLTLTLTNTTGVTKAQGDALTGILFNLGKKATLQLDSISLSKDSHLWMISSGDIGSEEDGSGSLAGSWTNALASKPPLAASFGVATTGFNGEFNGGSITLGNASPDYGIIGHYSSPNSFGGDKKSEFVDDSLTFKMHVTSGSLTESDFTGATFLFGTSGQGWLQGTLVPTGDGNPGGGQAPEPAPFVLLGTAAIAARLARRAR